MRLLLDMNLSPDWVPKFIAAGLDVLHWAEVGDPAAADHKIMAWARQNDCAILTLDLDFGTILALSRETGPSVVQIRCRDALSAKLQSVVISVIQQYWAELESGALLTIDDITHRCRILPI